MSVEASRVVYLLRYFQYIESSTYATSPLRAVYQAGTFENVSVDYYIASVCPRSDSELRVLGSKSHTHSIQWHRLLLALQLWVRHKNQSQKHLWKKKITYVTKRSQPMLKYIPTIWCKYSTYQAVFQICLYWVCFDLNWFLFDKNYRLQPKNV